MKRTIKLVAAVLALVMVLMTLPAAMAAEETHTLETATDLVAFAKGDKADGETEIIGDYFTIYYSANTKVDGTSNKTWGTEEDDFYYAIGADKVNRLNLGGKTGWSSEYVAKNAIAFTTSGNATVKIWAVSGGADRNITIQTDKETVIATYENTLESNTPIYVEFALTDANTYYICNPVNNNYFLKIEVVETTAPEAPETTAPEAPETTAPEAPETTAPEAPETTAPEAPETTAPEAPETTAPVATTAPAGTQPGGDADRTGDMTFVVIFVMLASATVLVVLTQKKRAF